MRKLVTRIAYWTLAVTAVVGFTAGFEGCNPPPNCSNLTSQYADTPVKNLSQSNAELTVFCLTNDQRVVRGLPAYTLSSLLGGTARAHAQDSVTRKWWGTGDPHVNPDGKTPEQRIRAAGYCSGSSNYATAENVYWGWGSPPQTPRSAVTWWMNSTPHRNTILSTSLKELGVGVVLGAPQTGGPYPDAAVFVQNFGRCN